MLGHLPVQLQFVANTAPARCCRVAAAPLSTIVPRKSISITRLTAVRGMAHSHEAPNVEAAAAALTEAEAMHASDLQLSWWSKLRWRQTSKEEAVVSERSMLSRLVK